MYRSKFAKYPEKVQYLFEIDCVQRALERERLMGREPSKWSWKAIGAIKAWLNNKLSLKDLAYYNELADEAYEAADEKSAEAASQEDNNEVFAAAEAASYAAYAAAQLCLPNAEVGIVAFAAAEAAASAKVSSDNASTYLKSKKEEYLLQEQRMANIYFDYVWGKFTP